MKLINTKYVIGLLALAVTFKAEAQVTIDFSRTPVPLHIYNEFTSDLTARGQAQTVNSGAVLTLSNDSLITFELLGTGGGYLDTFTANGIPTYTENATFDQNSFAAPIQLGSAAFAAGTLAGQLWFTNSVGRTVTVGDEGFGLYVPEGFHSGTEVSTFYFGYDDEVANLADSDFDDLVIRATVLPAVPEPATWLMMILGFFVVGSAMRFSCVKSSLAY